MITFRNDNLKTIRYCYICYEMKKYNNEGSLLKALKSYGNKLICISLTLIFFSCNKCHSYEGDPKQHENILPTAEDLTWVNFNNGDSIFFKNNLNQFDTMMIKIIEDYGSYEYGPHYGVFNSCETVKYPVQTLVYFGDTIHFLNGPSIYSPNSNSNIPVEFGWTDFQQVNHYVILTNSTFNSINIDGILYDNVYIQSFDTMSVSSGFVWQVFYQKEKGILRFDQTGGIKWERLN